MLGFTSCAKEDEMKRLGSVLASIGVAYYGVMTVAYLAKEARGSRLVRSIAGTLAAYYAAMGVVYLIQEVGAKANADSGLPAGQGDGTASLP